MIDCYVVLNVTKNATQQEIKDAYRKLAMKWHPDKNLTNNKAECEKKFIEISEAYNILSDPNLKDVFDNEPKCSCASNGGDQSRQDFDFFSETKTSQSPNMFVRTNFKDQVRYSPSQSGSGPHTSRSLLDEINAMYRDSQTNLKRHHGDIYGTFFSFDPFEIFDREFAAAAAAAAAGPVYAQRLPVKRKLMYYINFNVSLEQLYLEKTVVIDNIYERIAQNGSRPMIPKNKTIWLKLHSHWRDGHCVSLDDEDIGTLEVRIIETAHHIFTRNGDDLSCKISMSLHDALVSSYFNINVFGHVYKIDKNEVFDHTTVKIIEGYGMKTPTNKRGNILVSFDIIYPKTITRQQSNLIEQAFNIF